MRRDQLGEHARPVVIDSNRYMTLGTADDGVRAPARRRAAGVVYARRR